MLEVDIRVKRQGFSLVVNFTADKEVLGILGASGSGKSLTLKCIAGIETPDFGKIVLDGRVLFDSVAGINLPPQLRRVGYLFQDYALFPHMTVEENIAFPLRVQRRSAADIRRRVDEMVEMMGLAGHGKKRPSGLSGGQQQRVALARALVYEPPVLLLDEPFSALDKNLRGQMQDEVRRLHRETGTTFVFVTHDQSEALALSNRVAIFDHGKLQQLASPKEAYERPANRFVAEFLGEINILPLSNVRKNGGAILAEFEGQALHAGGDATMSETLAVRPEYMALHLARPADGNAIAARLHDLTYLGAETQLSLRTAGGVGLNLSLPTATLPQGVVPGQEVWAAWPKERAFFL